MRGKQKAMLCKFLLFGGAFIVWSGRKSCLRQAEIEFFSSRDLSGSNKHDTFCDVAPTAYFYVLFLSVISVSNFLSLEIYKNLGPTLSCITFTVNSYVENHFYQYIYLF